ncbi:MAG: 16S rRNA (cytosine(1402)-N(4))-methyltransferase RsmH [Salibacteraceae bacterium]
MTAYHQPVLLRQSVEGLGLRPEGVYVDVTYGGGGHSQEILKRLEGGRLIAFDQDEEAAANQIEDDRLVLVQQNFRYLRNFLRLHSALPIHGLLADLGVSSRQFDAAERGFSIRQDAMLDMRMNRQGGLTAREVVNEWEEAELWRIFRNYGEVKNARRLAQVVAKERTKASIDRVSQLIGAIAVCIDRRQEHRYLAQVFQALRIAVNDELGALEALLVQATESLATGGRLVVISYHSLEDRMVKHFMRAGNFKGEVEKDFYGNPIRPLKPLSNKVITPDATEIEENNRARSAKMRIAEKL